MLAACDCSVRLVVNASEGRGTCNVLEYFRFDHNSEIEQMDAGRHFSGQRLCIIYIVVRRESCRLLVEWRS